MIIIFFSEKNNFYYIILRSNSKSRHISIKLQLKYYVIFFDIILRNMLQCYVTIKVTLGAKSNIYHVLFCLYTMYRKKKVMVIMDKCIGKKLYMQLLYYRKFFLNRQIHLAQHTRRQHPFEEDDWIKSNSQKKSNNKTCVTY